MILDKLGFFNKLRIVLASGSPRRKELLTKVGLKFDVKVSGFAEDLDKSAFSTPADYVMETARRKAMDVALKLPKKQLSSSSSVSSSAALSSSSECTATMETPADLVIGSDTIVVFNEREILEKPSDKADAIAMLTKLSGNTHQVITSVTLVKPSMIKEEEHTTDDELFSVRSFYAKTQVKFAELSPDLIEHYVQTGEPMDKAGGYGIQGIASQFVEGIDGCYYNVMGFPVHQFCSELRSFFESDDQYSKDFHAKETEDECQSTESGSKRTKSAMESTDTVCAKETAQSK